MEEKHIKRKIRVPSVNNCSILREKRFFIVVERARGRCMAFFIVEGDDLVRKEWLLGLTWLNMR